jgi:hypothetical protein
MKVRVVHKPRPTLHSVDLLGMIEAQEKSENIIKAMNKDLINFIMISSCLELN